MLAKTDVRRKRGSILILEIERVGIARGQKLPGKTALPRRNLAKERILSLRSSREINTTTK